MYISLDFLLPTQLNSSLNYGAMGVVMGHELTHAFDDQGRKFDAAGTLKQWWSNSSVRAFDDRASCFVTQYSGFTVYGKHVSTAPRRYSEKADKQLNLVKSVFIKSVIRVSIFYMHCVLQLHRSTFFISMISTPRRRRVYRSHVHNIS